MHIYPVFLYMVFRVLGKTSRISRFLTFDHGEAYQFGPVAEHAFNLQDSESGSLFFGKCWQCLSAVRVSFLDLLRRRAHLSCRVRIPSPHDPEH